MNDLGGGGSVVGGGSSDVGLAEVIGFVTEFNHNVAIFESTAVLLMALFQESILAEYRFEALEDLIKKMSKDTITAAKRADQQIFAEALSKAYEADKQMLLKAVTKATEEAVKAAKAAVGGSRTVTPVGAAANSGATNFGDRAAGAQTAKRLPGQDFSAAIESELKNRDLRRP